MDNWTATTSTSSSSSSNESNPVDGCSTGTGILLNQEQQQQCLPGLQVATITPPPQSRPGQPPARVGRRIRRRRRASRPRGYLGSSHRRLFQNISQEGNQTGETITTDANISSASVSSQTPIATTSAANPTPTPTTTSIATTTTPVNLAVRALFRDQQQQQQEIRGRAVSTTSHSGLITGTRINYSSHHCDDTQQNYRNYLVTRPINNRPTSVSIIDANRRLIERQIEAIRDADSNRWNFDFRNCRPLNQIGHRYVGCTTTNVVTENNNDINYSNNNNIAITSNNGNMSQTSSTATAHLRNIKPLNDKNQTQDH